MQSERRKWWIKGEGCVTSLAGLISLFFTWSIFQVAKTKKLINININ